MNDWIIKHHFIIWIIKTSWTFKSIIGVESGHLLIAPMNLPLLHFRADCQLSFAIFQNYIPVQHIKETKLEMISSWNQTIMRMLLSRDYLVVLSLIPAVLGDYQGYSNYVYPETYSYPDNASLASYGHQYHSQPTERSRRTLDQGLIDMEASEILVGELHLSFVSNLALWLPSDCRLILKDQFYHPI